MKTAGNPCFKLKGTEPNASAPPPAAMHGGMRTGRRCEKIRTPFIQSSAQAVAERLKATAIGEGNTVVTIVMLPTGITVKKEGDVNKWRI